MSSIFDSIPDKKAEETNKVDSIIRMLTDLTMHIIDLVVDRKALSAAFLPKILAETRSVSAERNRPFSAFLQKEQFLPKEGVSAEIRGLFC